MSYLLSLMPAHFSAASSFPAVHGRSQRRAMLPNINYCRCWHQSLVNFSGPELNVFFPHLVFDFSVAIAIMWDATKSFKLASVIIHQLSRDIKLNPGKTNNCLPVGTTHALVIFVVVFLPRVKALLYLNKVHIVRAIFRQRMLSHITIQVTVQTGSFW